MTEEAVEKKSAVRKARNKSIIVVGAWFTEADGTKFVRLTAQPPETTDLAEAIAWAKANLPPGRYEFIRQLTRTLTLSEQKLIKATIG